MNNRKKIMLILLNIISIFFFSTIYAENSKYEITFLLGSGNLEVSGYENAVFNDGAYFSGSSVGATYVEFSKANQKSSVMQ